MACEYSGWLSARAGSRCGARRTELGWIEIRRDQILVAGDEDGVGHVEQKAARLRRRQRLVAHLHLQVVQRAEGELPVVSRAV